MIDAVLATEDARFYEHPGIDPIGIIRAATVWAVSGQARQGASTITQQVARNFFLSNEKTLVRKIKRSSWPGASSRISQGRDPAALSQQDPARLPGIRGRCRRPGLLWQGGQGPDAGRDRHHRRSAQGAVHAEPDPLAGACLCPSQRGTWPHAGNRQDHPGPV